MVKEQKKPRLLILGPQGSGKGTQADLLAEHLNIPHISMGQVLRDITKNPNHPLAQELADLMNQGVLVPNKLTNELAAERISQDDCRQGFIFDGYPRHMEQAEALEKITTIDWAILVNISDDEALKRIAGRRNCPNGHIWHVEFNPPKEIGVCDTCGAKLFQRDDDNEEAVKKRLEIYHRESDPVINFYEISGRLIKINGEQKIEKVFADITRQLTINN